MPHKKARIGIILPEFPSYTETFILSQVKGLCDRGYAVTVFCSLVNKNVLLEKSFRLTGYQNLRIRQLSVPGLLLNAMRCFFFRPALFFSSWIRTGEEYRKALHTNLCKMYFNYYGCAVYHFGYSATAIAYMHLLDGLKGKKVISCQGTAENVKPVTEPGRIKKLYTVFNKADKIHAVSGHMRELIIQYGAPPDKIFINRPAVDTAYFSRQSDYEPAATIKILSVGRLIFQKGLVTGVLAMKKLVNTFTSFEWLIAGDGPDYEELAFEIHALGMNKEIQLLGRKTREEIHALYEGADIFFLPSVSEGIANVVLEAMSMELPVVSSDAGGMREAITDQVDGMICPVDDHAAMAEALHWLAKHYEIRKQMGIRARQKITENYSIIRYIDVFEHAYQQLLD